MKSVYEKPYRFCPNCKTSLKKKSIDNQKLLTCSKCNFVFWNNPKPVVSIILSKHRKVLMIQRAQQPLKGFWCLPGGFINYGERPDLAILREASEEIGVNLKVKNLVGVYRIDNDPRGVTIDIIYQAPMTGKIFLSDEHVKFDFFTPNKLPKKIAYKHRQAIEDWLKARRKHG